MFKVQDTVLYGVHGVCTVSDISKMEFGDSSREYYVLRPVYDKGSTIYVPTDSEELTSRMRRILSEEEIFSIIRDMPTETAEWISNDTERRKLYTGILRDGDRKGLVRLLKTIYARKKELGATGRKLHVSDEQFFRDAEKMLYEEFAHVIDIEKDEVVPFICERIERDI